MPPQFTYILQLHSRRESPTINLSLPRRKSPPPISRTLAPSSRPRPWWAHTALILWRWLIVGSHQLVWPNPLMWGPFRLVPLSNDSSLRASFVEAEHCYLEFNHDQKKKRPRISKSDVSCHFFSNSFTKSASSSSSMSCRKPMCIFAIFPSRSRKNKDG